LPVNFTDPDVPAKRAIETVAHIDSATVEYDTPLSGDVVFTNTRMRDPEAAAEIAAQMSIHWRAFYIITKRGGSNARIARIMAHRVTGPTIAQMSSARQTNASTGNAVINTAPQNTDSARYYNAGLPTDNYSRFGYNTFSPNYLYGPWYGYTSGGSESSPGVIMLPPGAGYYSPGLKILPEQPAFYYGWPFVYGRP
jgi:hypothetical protein